MNELTMRLLTLGASVVYYSARSYYERRLHRPMKAEQLRQASPKEMRDLMIAGLSMVPVWAYMLTPYVDFAAIGLALPVRAVGLALALAATPVLAASHAALGASWSPFGDVPPADGLVTSGVYRWVRHPMYASFFLFNIGILLLSSNWFAVPGIFGMLWLYYARVDHEERMMLELFGDEYRGYARKTGRVVPGLGRGRLAGERLV